MVDNTQVRKYYAFQFIRSLEFFGPVVVLFWLSNGLNMTEVMLLQSIYAVGVVLLELPTGAVADYFGKKMSLVVGSLLFSIGLIYYGLGSHFWQFVIGELTVASGAAFISGADSALIHELLLQDQREGEYKRIEGRARASANVGRVVGNVLGGLIASVSLGLTLVGTGLAGLVSVVIASLFPKAKEKIEREENLAYGQIIRESLKLSLKNKKILWLTLFFTGFNSIVFSVNFLAQPYLQKLGVPVLWFGVIFGAFGLINAVGSALTDEYSKIVGEGQYVLLTVVAVITFVALGLVHSVWIFPLWALVLTLLTINQTLVSGQVMDLVPHGQTATVLSFQNLTRRLVYAVVGPMMGFMADTWSIYMALMVAAVLLVVVLAPILLMQKRWG